MKINKSIMYSLTKLNSFFSSLAAGDSALLKRGETFYGSITVSKSGTAGLAINIGSYGTGAKPVITGFTTVAGWSDLGSNIWESTSAVSTLSSVNMVVVNGANTAMGRYPNTGYLKYQNSTGSSITSSSLTGSPNWAGAEAVIRMYRWVIDRCSINSQSGGTLNFTDNDGRFQYSNIINVTFKNTINGTVSIESTGTCRDRFEISINSTKTQSASYAIYDATGRVLYKSNILLQTGLNGITKNMMLPDAVYYFKLQISEEKLALPLINRN